MAETLPQAAPPDLSGLTQPGAGPVSPTDAASAAAPMGAPAPAAPPAEAMTPGMAPPDITNRSINPTVPPAPPAGVNPANVPHARLLAMVNGLATGLSAFGKSVSTGGREGGPQEVIQERGEEQRQREEAQQAAQAQKNAQLQNQIQTASLNHLNTQNILLNATLPDEISQSHVKTESAGVELAGQKFGLFANTGMSPDQINQLVQGGKVDAKTSNILQANAQMNYRIASQLLPPDNPSLAAMKGAIDDPNTPPATLVTLNNRLQAELKGQEGVTDAQIKKAQAAASAPFGDEKASDMNAALLKRYQVLNPKATYLPPGLSLDANSTSKDFDRVDKIMQQTEQAQGTKSNQDVVHAMRQEQLDMMKGVVVPGDETKTGAEYLATLPAGLQGTVKAIGEGRAAPPPAGSRSPAAQTLLAALNRAYPDYDATKYPSYLKAREAFTSGPEGKGINAINTVETHLARMFQHASAPGTSGGVTGKVTGFFGDKDVRALDVDRTAVSTELSKAYAAGQISEGEVKDWENKLDFTKPGMTTGKLITNLKEIDGLLEGKQKAYERQWSAASPSSSIVSPVPIITPDASDARAIIRGEKTAPTSQHNPGDRVTLKNGQQVVIKTINSDGTFTY